MIHMKLVQREDLIKNLTKKMAPPLGTFQLCSTPTHEADPSHAHLIRAGGPMGRTAEYQPSAAEASRHIVQRDARILLQIQRSAICQGGEAGHHGQAGKRGQRRYASGRVERVSHAPAFSTDSLRKIRVGGRC